MISEHVPAMLLSIETGILGGSICLFQNEIPIDHFIGNKDASRAEDLISDIDVILNKNAVRIEQIDTIAVSRGPGSYTGIRIGLSTVLGLSVAVQANVVGVPLLEAVSEAVQIPKPNLVLVPFGRNEFAWQEFDHQERGQAKHAGPQIGFLHELSNLIDSKRDHMLICHPNLNDIVSIPNSLAQQDIQEIKVMSHCLAENVGKWALAHRESADLTPIYSFNPAKKTGSIY